MQRRLQKLCDNEENRVDYQVDKSVFRSVQIRRLDLSIPVGELLGALSVAYLFTGRL
jgi:hypothetical protein